MSLAAGTPSRQVERWERRRANSGAIEPSRIAAPAPMAPRSAKPTPADAGFPITLSTMQFRRLLFFVVAQSSKRGILWVIAG